MFTFVIVVEITFVVIANLFRNLLTLHLCLQFPLCDELHLAVLDILGGANLLQNVLINAFLLVCADRGRNIVVWGQMAEWWPDFRPNVCPYSKKHNHQDLIGESIIVCAGFLSDIYLVCVSHSGWCCEMSRDPAEMLPVLSLAKY